MCAKDAPDIVHGPQWSQFQGTKNRTPVLGFVGGQGGDYCCSERSRVLISSFPLEPQPCAHFLCQDP